MILGDPEKANLLNSYFVSVGTIDNGVLPPLPVLVEEADSKLDLITYRTQQIRLILKKLKNKISSGPDGLPPILFHNLANQLAYPLTTIFNLFMQAGTVPDIWRQARVTPIFKKGSSSVTKNYRPISLTCVGCKIFETAIKTVLVPFLEGKKLISVNQHGFRPGHSTCLNLLESLNDWTLNLDSKIDTFVAHIDFARAFDSVSLPKLVHKLKWAGINGSLLSCIESLLFNRRQQVKVGNSLSNLETVISGVPQGSVLGPILFIFYINDITNINDQSCTPKLYADDLKAYNSGINDSDGTKFKKSLNDIANWAETWQLPISSEKSKYLLISNKKRNPEPVLHFQLHGSDLPQTSEVIDLGVNFNSKLNFSDHISSTIAKAKQRLFLLRKICLSKNPTIKPNSVLKLMFCPYSSIAPQFGTLPTFQIFDSLNPSKECSQKSWQAIKASIIQCA